MKLKAAMGTFIRRYFLIAGVFGHIVLAGLIILNPQLFFKGIDKLMGKYYASAKQAERESLRLFPTVKEEIDAVFEKWMPLAAYPSSSTHLLNGEPVNSLKEALSRLKPGDVLEIAEGVYQSPIILNVDRVTLIGRGHVVFEKAAARGKGYIINTANDITIKNIECRNISVPDRNGACIRQEGANLTLEHVYFRNSENGILESTNKPSKILIYDSRFEQLGRAGRAHGIYTNTAQLYIYDSLFIAAKGEGHEIKSRGAVTEIHGSIITSLSSVDSRLIDVPNGGKLVISNSLLHQGGFSANSQAIGYGLEGRKHSSNAIEIKDSLFLFDRIGFDNMLAIDKSDVQQQYSRNLLIGEAQRPEMDTSNIIYDARDEVNFPSYPFLPQQWCRDTAKCVIKSKSE